MKSVGALLANCMMDSDRGWPPAQINVDLVLLRKEGKPSPLLEETRKLIDMVRMLETAC